MEKNISINITLTPEELAKEFTNMDSHEQAIFFNTIATITNTWINSFCMQLQFMTDSSILTSEGRSIMEEIGNYSKP